MIGFIGAGLMVAVIVLFQWCLLWRAKRSLPGAISARLMRGDAEVRLRTTFAIGAWNPARPLGRNNATEPGKGTATYRLSPEGSVVRDLRTADGQQRQFVGPAVSRPSGSLAVRRANAALAMVAAVYVGATAVGTAAGYAMRGSSAGAIFAGGVIGLMLATILLPVVTGFARARARAGRDGRAR